MAGGTHRRGDLIEGINVTPLVDVMLVLLVVFVVTAPMLDQQGIPLDIPSASDGESIVQTLAVAIDRNEGIHVDGVATTHDALVARAATALTADPSVRAVIAADGSVPHRRIVATIYALRTAGIRSIAFATVPPENANDAAR